MRGIAKSKNEPIVGQNDYKKRYIFTMSQIPSYTLYGEVFDKQGLLSINIEPISRRAPNYDWNIQPHQHGNLLQLLFVEQGGGITFFDGKDVPFSAPCFIVIPSGTVHGFDFEKNIDGYVVTVAQEQVEAILSGYAPGAQHMLAMAEVISLEPDSVFLNSLRTLCELAEKESELAQLNLEHSSNYLVASILIAIGRASVSATTPHLSHNSRKSDLVEKFRIAVNDSWSEGHSVNDFADMLGITPSHLRRLCQEVLGESPLSIINKRIVLAAQRDLAYSSMTVQQVAYSLGFEDSAYFSRFFRKQTGQTPSQFRLSIRSNL